jgi:hypothetical protein
MSSEQTRFPLLRKSEPALPSPEAHARALELACRAAAQITQSRGKVDDAQEPLPASSTRLLRRLARSRG